MPWRLLRRCLLFGLLGLVTAVAVAWGLSVRWQAWVQQRAPSAQGIAVVEDTVVRVTVHRLAGYRSECWQVTDTTKPGWIGHAARRFAERIREVGGAAFDEEARQGVASAAPQLPPGAVPPRRNVERLDDLAAGGPPESVRDVANLGTWLTRCDQGWPALALRYTHRQDLCGFDDDDHGIPARMETAEQFHSALEIPWSWKTATPTTMTPETIALPLAPRPGLLLNTIFYGLLWAVLLLAPRALRCRIRRARGRCPKCGYSLTGQAAPGCPECGHGREEVAEWQSGEVAK